MKKEEEHLELLLQRKAVNELTAEEREFVLNVLGSLDEYESMQKIESALMNSITSAKPSPLILLSLKAQMKERYVESSALARFFDFRIPAYAAVLLVLVGSALTAWLSVPTTKTPPMISVMERIDTLVVIKTDTVIKERVVYRLARNYVAPARQVFPVEPVIENMLPKAVGVSMKEKEELNKLLVSGSE